MTDALVKRNYETLQTKLLSSKDKVAELLGGMMDPQKFIRGVLLAVSKTPKLLQATPSSVYLAAMQAAELGLAISDLRGEAFLVPYKNRRTGTLEAQLQTGYKGLVKLAYKTGLIDDIVCELVYEGDKFVYSPSNREQPVIHEVNISVPRSRDKLIAAYMIAWLKNSVHPHVEVMLRADLDKIRDMALKRSASGESELWTNHYEEACRKTVLRRGLKYLPLGLTQAGEVVAEAVAVEEALMSGQDVVDELPMDTAVELPADATVEAAEDNAAPVVEEATRVIRSRRNQEPKQAKEVILEEPVVPNPPETPQTKLFDTPQGPGDPGLIKAAMEEISTAFRDLPSEIYVPVKEAVFKTLGINNIMEFERLGKKQLTMVRRAAAAIMRGARTPADVLAAMTEESAR